jgi:hypothetical protein
LLGLADLLAVGAKQERCGDAVRFVVAAQHAVDQIDPRHDVAVLVRARHLHAAVEAAMQVQEVVRLQQHVAELGVADALLAIVQTVAHRVSLDHRVDREVLPDVAQHVDEAEPVEPRGVVDDPRAVRALRIEIDQLLHDLALTGDIGPDRFFIEERALDVLARRIADLARAAAHQDDRLVSGVLPVLEQHHRDDVADREAVLRGIEAAIRDATGRAQVRG